MVGYQKGAKMKPHALLYCLAALIAGASIGVWLPREPKTQTVLVIAIHPDLAGDSGEWGVFEDRWEWLSQKILINYPARPNQCFEISYPRLKEIANKANQKINDRR
jgi:hypothetical protein